MPGLAPDMLCNPFARERGLDVAPEGQTLTTDSYTIQNLMVKPKGGISYHIIHVIPTERLFAFPFLFVIGMWSGAWMFDAMMKTLARLGIESYALDLRGHGRSDAVVLDKVTTNDYVDDVERVIRFLNRQFVLVGHSMGARIAARVAHRDYRKWKAGEKRRVTDVIFLCPGGGIPGFRAITTMWKYAPAMLKPLQFVTRKIDAFRLLFNNMPEGEFNQIFPYLGPESGQALLEASFEPFMWWVDNPPPMRKKYFYHALFIKAEYDNITPWRDNIPRKLGFPVCDIKSVKTDHMPMLSDSYPVVANIMYEWVRKTMPSYWTRPARA
jgi:pimeloyl-ACP methyl ester carboxylesterase